MTPNLKNLLWVLWIGTWKYASFRSRERAQSPFLVYIRWLKVFENRTLNHMKLFLNRTHYQIHTVQNVPHPDMFIEAWTTILNVCYVIVFWKAWESNKFLINTLPHSILYGFVTISALKGILNHDILSFVSKTIDLSNYCMFLRL